MTRTRRSVMTGMAGAACLWLLTGTLAGQASRAEMLLQQALTKELVEQDRAGAVVLYQQVIATPGVPAGVATRARARVAALRPAGAQSNALVRRVVYEDTGWIPITVSPDGRFAIGRSGVRKRDLILRTLPAKDDRVLFRETETASGFNPVFSPSGTMVAFTWDESQGNVRSQSVGVIGTSPNSTPRRITPAVAGLVDRVAPTPIAWSADGSSVIVRTARHSYDGRVSAADFDPSRVTASALEWVSVTSGTTTKSIPFPIQNENAVMSPSGGHFAYERASSTGNPTTESRIYTIDVSGQNETAVVTLAGRHRFPVWTADGSAILFVSNRSGRDGLWAVTIQSGQATGEPLLVQDALANIGVNGFTATIGGSVFLRQAQPAQQHVFISERGVPGARGLRAYSGGFVSWSPDGTSVAFAKSVGAGQGNSLIIKDVTTGDERQFDHPSRLDNWQVRWSRNGASILVVIRGAGLHIFDVASGQFRQIPNPEGRLRAPVADISPDGKTVYVASRAAGGATAGVPFTDLVSVDVATGAERKLADLAAVGHAGTFGIPPAIAVSPDGQYVALQVGRADPPVVTARVALVAADGSGSRFLSGPYRMDTIPGTITWTSDGQSVLFFIGSSFTGGTQPPAWRLMRVSIGGGEPVFDGLEKATLLNDSSLPLLTLETPFSLTASPDGSRVAFGASAGAVSQLVALDNVNAVIARAR